MNPEYRKIVFKAATYLAQHQISSNVSNFPSIAVIDTGIFPHKNIRQNIIGFHDAVSEKDTPYDDNGHGTHVAGIICGIPSHIGKRIQGVFPFGKIFVLKALDKDGNGKITNFINGMEYLLEHREKYQIRTINISLGAEFDNSLEHQALIDCVEYAWDCGITICAAAGNNGPEKGSITVPGISKKIITIGTYDDYIPMSRSNNNSTKKNYSGKGPTNDCIIKPDILCPGSNILSLDNSPAGYAVKSGTSMSTPMISALAGLITAIHPDVTPKELKKAIKAAHPPGSLHFDCSRFFSCF